MSLINEIENIRNDDKVGNDFWFEYHCLESDASCDAELWKRSHQKVKVVSVIEPGIGDSPEERAEEGAPRVYKIMFEDGFEYDVFEDELMNSPKDFFRYGIRLEGVCKSHSDVESCG